MVTRRVTKIFFRFSFSWNFTICTEDTFGKFMEEYFASVIPDEEAFFIVLITYVLGENFPLNVFRVVFRVNLLHIKRRIRMSTERRMTIISNMPKITNFNRS